MADGSGVVIQGRVRYSHEADCPTLADIKPSQHLVGCCDRCQRVREVDAAAWTTPRDRWSSLAAIQGQVACPCGCRQVTLQVWPVAPSAPAQPPFYRWR